MASQYARTGGQATPPQQNAGNSKGQISTTGQSSNRVFPSQSQGGWRRYANSSGQVTSPPDYPDVSYPAYLRAGGNLLGIGYNAWRDRLLADYNTAYNMYQQWYDSAAQQVTRIIEAGLNTNLGYSMASPGSSPGGALAQSSGPSPEQVFFGGINALAGLASGTKALAEAAQIVAALPESKLKGRIAKQIDAAAKAGAINAENTYLGSLYGARNSLGVGASKAQQESADAAYHKAQSEASKSLLDYMTTHDNEGSESDFEGSIYTQSSLAGLNNEILIYTKNKLEFDKLFSNPKYYRSILDKLVAEKEISQGQAFVARTIMESKGNSDFDKALMLQSGLPGVIFKLLGFINSERSQTRIPWKKGDTPLSPPGASGR